MAIEPKNNVKNDERSKAMNEILIIAIIIAIALVVGIAIVWRQQIRLVKDAEWLNSNRLKHKQPKTGRDIEQQLYEGDVIEIDHLEQVHGIISGQNLRTILNNHKKREGKDKSITWD